MKTKSKKSHGLSFSEKEISGLTDHFRKSRWEKGIVAELSRFIEKTGIKIYQVGRVDVDPGLDPEDFGWVAWVPAYDAAIYPTEMTDDEIITVFDLAGKQVAKSPFKELLLDDLKNLGPHHFWIREQSQIDDVYAWSFTNDQLGQIENVQKQRGWLSKAGALAEEACQNADRGDQALSTLAVRRMPEFAPEAFYLGILMLPLDRNLPLTPEDAVAFPDEAKFAVHKIGGELVAEKAFRKFTFAELKKYAIDHFWFFLEDKGCG